MITYTQFLESDIGTYILSYFKELMERHDYVGEHKDDIEKNTSIIDRITDDTMYDIYETLLGGIEHIEDEVADYYDELESDINDGVYDD